MSVIASSDEMLEVTTAAMIMPSHALDFTQISEEGLKKIRKPYTISKSRESWSEQEHEKFLEALQLFDRDWKKIEAFIGSKTVIQIRSHAQKYFLKVQKNGSGEHVPPPRPKRKSLQPYPQKASKCALLSQPVLSHGRLDSMQTDSLHSDSPQKGNVFVPSVSGTPTISAWSYDAVSPGSITVAPLDLKPSDLGRSVRGGSAEALGCREGTFFGRGPEKLQSTDQGNGEMQIRANPDFSKIYSFIGSVFDPSVKGHLKTLKDMAVIDCETIVLLMTNLAINLSSPDFEQNDVTDAITSVSGHAGEAKIASPDLSVVVRMQQPIALEKSCKETLQQWGHPYDTGGGGGSCQSHSLLSASNEQPSDLQCCPLGIEDKFQNISDSNVDCFALDLQLLQSTNGADDMHTSWWA